jgi:transposase
LVGTTITLFAALEQMTGKLITRTEASHTHVEWLRFLKQIDRETPRGLDLHLIADNYATHKHPKICAWLARHPRWTFHFTPTSASWLNAVEGFFATLTKRRPQAWRVPIHRRTADRHQSFPRNRWRFSRAAAHASDLEPTRCITGRARYVGGFARLAWRQQTTASASPGAGT